MAPNQLTPEQVHQQKQALLDSLNAEIARRGDASSDASTRSSPSPEGEPRGTIRTHNEIDASDASNPASILFGDLLSPYTLEEGRAYKRHKNLSATSDASADQYLKTVNPMRQGFQTYVAILECSDKLEVIRNDANSKYKLPDTVAKTAQDYAQVAILAPNVKNYRNPKDGSKMEVAIAGAMRTVGVAQLPPTFETGRCEVLNKVLGKACIDKRCHIKTEVSKSIADSNVKVDIATLTRSCIGASPVKASAALYQRIAFIRKVAVECQEAAAALPDVAGGTKTAKEDAFWLEVDKKLALWRLTFSPSQMQIMVEKIYSEDITAYGDADAAIPITAMRDLEDWLATLNKTMETLFSPETARMYYVFSHETVHNKYYKLRRCATCSVDGITTVHNVVRRKDPASAPKFTSTQPIVANQVFHLFSHLFPHLHRQRAPQDFTATSSWAAHTQSGVSVSAFIEARDEALTESGQGG
ncbi:hypothetical protein B0H16DRAFT_1897606 [Mycena metata]|uniref:Uncharacterized protein n=1 Tax=Mycena metata TaxID=1033252 RepID=A0AAD7HE61_9AGAR|nr:hypothetical protein B0H16DRAFT_1897606 [Mycena metata]